MKAVFLSVSLGLFFIFGCGPKMPKISDMVMGKKGEEKTQLQIRQMQTRTYDTQDVDMIIKTMLNVLQDDDFIINQVNPELGFLNATKEVYMENKTEKGWQYFWWGPLGTWTKNLIVDCTANISEFGDQTRIRVNFRVKVLDNKGAYVAVQQADNPKFYQDFFAKIDKGIFIEKEQL